MIVASCSGTPTASPTTAPAAAAPTGAPSQPSASAPTAAPAAAPTAAAKPTTAPQAAAAPSSGTPTTIVFITTLSEPARVDGQKALIDKFQKAQSDVKVNFQVSNWNDAPAKFMAMVAANAPPDTSTGGNTWPLTYANQGAIRDADDTLAAIGGKDGFYPSELVAYQFKGKTWALPMYQTPDVLFYRKDWFEQKGIKVPDIDKDYSFTWDTYMQTATSLTGNGIYGVVEPCADIHGYKPLWGLMLSNNVSVLDKDNKLAYNNQGTIETYDFVAKLYKAAAPPGEPTYQASDSTTAIKSSKAAMTIWNTGLLRETKLDQPDLLSKLGVIGTPKKQTLGGFKGAVNFMLYKTKNVEAVNTFYQFVYKKENYIPLLLSYPELMLPSRPEAANAPEYLNSKELEPTKDQMAIAVKTLPNEYGLTLRYGPNPWGGDIEAKKILQNVLIDMLTNGTAAAVAVAKGEKALEDLMKS
jgi:ABC-type glycerol-3-phosphate transport system substrate-binding protein